jgi:hypothetical protein
VPLAYCDSVERRRYGSCLKKFFSM